MSTGTYSTAKQIELSIANTPQVVNSVLSEPVQ